MSKVSDIFDALKTVITTALPNCRQIPDPLIGDAAASPILAYGFSIAFGPGQPMGTGNVTCSYKFVRDVQIQLTRLIENTENEVTAYEATVKAMFEDQFTILKKIMAEPHLGGHAMDTDYLGDNGLVPLATVDEFGRHLDLTTTFQVKYKENLDT